MPGLTIGWEYLTGKCVATDPANRQRAEWPPHPVRVFMALAAAWFETGEDHDQGEALRWLEQLGDPQLCLPTLEQVFSRSVVDYYVPVNDIEPTSIASNRIAKRMASLKDEQFNDYASDISAEIDKSAKSSIAIPTILRMELTRRISKFESLTTLRRELQKKISAIDYKDFVLDAIGIVPEYRSKQVRTFPSVWVGDAHCFLHWPQAIDEDVRCHITPLTQLSGEVTRIGHSSSLVRMWIAESIASSLAGEIWVPDESFAELRVRRMTEGTLSLLDRQFNRRGREGHQLLAERISALKAEKPTGKGAKERKAAIKSEFEILQRDLDKIDARDPVRPELGLWTGYRRREAKRPPPVPGARFDSDLLILTQIDGPRLPLAATLAVTQSLRGAVMSHIGTDIPEWVSGHMLNGEPLRDVGQHLAFIPLPYVGSDYADGHLLGLGLVFPRVVPRPERGKVLGRLLVSETGDSREIKLRLGRLGVWTVRKRDWMEQRHALRPETWTAHPKGATTWATVTPVVLDRFPKHDPVKERDAWQDEVAGIIATACERLGLPAPVEVSFGTTCWHCGSPRSTVKRRSIRGHANMADLDAALGDGFPTFPIKGGNGARPQLHVCLRFAEPVVGPILLGAGRFLGYGLCKPLQERISR